MRVISKILQLLLQIYVAIFSSIPTSVGIWLRYFAYKPLFKKTTGFFHIDSGVTIIGFKNISFGKNISIQKNSYLFANEGNLAIGNNFFLGTNSQLCAVRGNITIGNNVLIASNCILRPDNHIIHNINIPIREQGYDIGNIMIHDDVWIGSNSVLLKDVMIEEGAVIGACSLVNKKVKKFEVVGGVPAKFIKQRGNSI